MEAKKNMKILINEGRERKERERKKINYVHKYRFTLHHRIPLVSFLRRAFINPRSLFSLLYYSVLINLRGRRKRSIFFLSRAVAFETTKRFVGRYPAIFPHIYKLLCDRENHAIYCFLDDFAAGREEHIGDLV